MIIVQEMKLTVSDKILIHHETCDVNYPLMPTVAIWVQL